ncbi:hypothetical protein F8M41_008075 [Gigaspora margarita]|uniref:Uncharacterized protein n=1 Tax=Gigaspora margarita TaxID=4874 RepID=A0A8H3X4S2_GIGMA|nr:hypothetical protein F8M41_008075 [Gigaspora margarita]
MESELNLLRQENARLITKISGIEREKLELKQILETRTVENAELRDRVAKLEQDYRQMQNDPKGNNSYKNFHSLPDSSDTPSSMSEQKPSEEMSDFFSEEPANELESVIAQPEQCKPNTVDAFLDEMHKKSVSDGIRQIQRALRIDNLFDKIGEDKIYYIKMYSADTILKFSNSQIQRVINHFTENPDVEFTDDPEDEKEDNDQINVLEVFSPNELTAPIPLTHISNSSDNSKEEVWFDGAMYFNEANYDNAKANDHNNDDSDSGNSAPTPQMTLAKADNYNDVYFDEKDLKKEEGESNEVKSDDKNSFSNSEEEMPDESDDDGYSGCDGYNRYGEFDRDYYYDLSSRKKNF